MQEVRLFAVVAKRRVNSCSWQVMWVCLRVQSPSVCRSVGLTFSVSLPLCLSVALSRCLFVYMFLCLSRASSSDRSAAEGASHPDVPG